MGRAGALPHRALGRTLPPPAKLQGQTREGAGEQGRGCPRAGCPGSWSSSPRLSQDPWTWELWPAPAAPSYGLPWGKLAALPAAEVRVLPLWRSNGSSLALLLLVRFSARGACFFVSRADASMSKLSFGVGAVNSCNNCSTVETTFNRTCSAGPCALTRKWACSHLPAI